MLLAAVALAAPWALVSHGGRAFVAWEETARVWSMEVDAEGGRTRWEARVRTAGMLVLQTRDGRNLAEVVPWLPTLVVVEGRAGEGVLRVERTLAGADLSGFELPWPDAGGGALVAGLDPHTWQVVWTAEGSSADEVRRAARGLGVVPRELGRVARGGARMELVSARADGRVVWEVRAWKSAPGAPLRVALPDWVLDVARPLAPDLQPE